jgi:predicted LPLAT superfamily acyltransferase
LIYRNKSVYNTFNHFDLWAVSSVGRAIPF